METLTKTSLMRAAVISGVNSITVKDISLPKIIEDEVLVKVKAVGICKTDIEILEGKHPFTKALFAKHGTVNLTPGHEWSGIVSEVGRECKNFVPGDHVVSETTISCGYCYYCKKGMSNLCENVEELGITRNGATAEYVSVPCKILHKIPSSISFKEAALIEPTAVALHSINRIFENNEKNSLDNRSILIFGDGPIGLLCMQAANIKNPKKVYLVGKSQKKLEVAKKLGCDQVINTFGCTESEAIKLIRKEVGENKIDVVIEATSNNTSNDNAINEALQVIRKKGTLMLLGLHNTLTMNINQIVFNELNIKGVLSSPSMWNDAIRFVSDKKIRVNDIITHEFVLDDISHAYEYVRRNSDEVIKAIVNINTL